MLDEYKQIYEEIATSGLPHWKKMCKNELIKKASIMENGPTRDSYVAAIMLNYWHKIPKFYSKCKLVATPEDIHTWLTTSVMYALDKRPWESESSSIYNDPNGPDKVVNRCMESRRITFYQQLNRYNRKINSAILSLDSLTEDYKDAAAPTYLDDYIYEIHNIVSQQFINKEYINAFLLNGILYENWEFVNNDYKKFAIYLKKIHTSQAPLIAEHYDLPPEIVEEAINFCNNITIDQLRRRVEYSLIKLKDLIKDVR